MTRYALAEARVASMAAVPRYDVICIVLLPRCCRRLRQKQLWQCCRFRRQYRACLNRTLPFPRLLLLTRPPIMPSPLIVVRAAHFQRIG